MDEPYKQAAKQTIKRRYQMLPYNYTLSYRQAKYGEPLVRPLYYQFANDSSAAKTEDEFMWGDEILVAPVLQKNAVVRKIYLPKEKWYDPADNKFFNGGQWIDYEVNLFKMPYFIKEGSFVPMYQGEGNTKEIVNSKMMVFFVPSKNKSSYELYEDDGESKNAIAQKQFALTNFNSSGLVNDEISIIISNNGNYINKSAQQEFDLIIPFEKKPTTVTLNGKAFDIDNSEGNLFLLGENHLLVIKTVYTGTPILVQIKL